MTLRITKVVLILLVGLWGLIGGIQNFIQAGAGFEAVAAVLSPDLTTVSGLASWQTEFGGLVLSTAFRYIGCVGIVAVFVQQPEAVQNHGLKVCGCTEISQESRQ